VRVQAKEEALIDTRISQRFHDHHRGHDIVAGSSELLGHRHALNAEAGALLPQLARKLAGLLSSVEIVVEGLARESDNSFTQLLLLVGPAEIHANPFVV
jgi:hypothetical protein